MKVTFFNALTLLFVALKLTGHVDWSWWLVLAPTWVPLVLFAVVMLVTVGLARLERRLETPNEKAARLLREMSKSISRK